jgi:hypothetical protein
MVWVRERTIPTERPPLVQINKVYPDWIVDKLDFLSDLCGRYGRRRFGTHRSAWCESSSEVIRMSVPVK